MGAIVLLRLPLLLSRLYIVILPKLQTDAVHTMSLIRRRRVPFSLEDMSQMTSTITADNLRPHQEDCRSRPASRSQT
jgi:hypothetical protein